MVQHRCRGARAATLHAVSARAGRQSLRRPARLRADRRADEPGAAARTGFRALPALSRGTRPRAQRRARARRRALHSAALVAQRRIARFPQRARKLLVARERRSTRQCLRLRQPAARDSQRPSAAAIGARGVAGAVRALRVRSAVAGERTHSRGAARRTRRARAGGRRAAAGAARAAVAAQVMRRASIARAVMAVVAVLVAATAAATPANPATAAASIVPVIPIPASVSPRAGSFIVQAGTPIYTSGDAEAARIAAYFADLVRMTHPVTLAVRRLPPPRVPAAVTPVTTLPAQAIVFRLDPQ